MNLQVAGHTSRTGREVSTGALTLPNHRHTDTVQSKNLIWDPVWHSGNVFDSHLRYFRFEYRPGCQLSRGIYGFLQFPQENVSTET
jgi:hypothetical protein